MEKSKLDYLIQYLESLEQNNIFQANDEPNKKNYTTLLLNCYIMQEKIPNEYFVGKNIKRKNSNISHTTESSQSTVLDQNNYYLDLIMSKNILSNSTNILVNCNPRLK